MKYISIDIETLGLDDDWCDVIEFGAVIDDLKTPIEELPRFHTYVTKSDDRYRGEPYAMAMHQTILKRIAKREEGWLYTPADMLAGAFYEFVRENYFKDEPLYCDKREQMKVNLAGKNFALFDNLFLTKPEINLWKNVKFHHRIIDPGSMYLRLEDEVVPGLETCLQRSGVEKSVQHTAVEDAIDVIMAVRSRLYSSCTVPASYGVQEFLDHKALGFVDFFKTKQEAKDYIDSRKDDPSEFAIQKIENR